jgi:hypothetical protein
VDDQLDVVDVDAPRGDVGGREHPHLTAAERGEVALACVLRQVAVEVDGGDPGRGELLGQPLRGVLGAGEQHRASVAGGELADDGVLVGGGDVEQVV